MKDYKNPKWTEKEKKRLQQAVWLFLILSILGSLWASSASYVRRLNMGHYVEKPSLPPETGVVRYEVAGHRFQIPVAYHYTVSEMRGNRWLNNDMKIQKVEGGIIFDAFLPDFKPYGGDVHMDMQKFRDHHIYVSLSNDPAGYPPDVLIQRMKNRVEERASPLVGLREFDGKKNKRKYFFQDPLNDSYFRMICDGVLCKTWIVFQKYPRLKVHYFYSENNIQQWADIRQGIKSLLDRFSVSKFNGEE